MYGWSQVANVATYNSSQEKEAEHTPFCSVFREAGKHLLVHHAERGQGFRNLKVTPAHLHTASPASPCSAATGHWPRGHQLWQRHVYEVHREWEEGADPVQAVSKAVFLHGGTYWPPDRSLWHRGWKTDLRQVMPHVVYILWQTTCNSLSVQC